MAPFKLPGSSPLATFVNDNYAPGLRKNAFKKLRSKGFLPPSATPTLPDSPLGRFVTESYAPANRMRVFKKLKANPDFKIPGSFANTPGEQKLELLPRVLIGREGVQGPYKAPPRVNPEEWEVHANQAGRYFIAPRTELSGLRPEQRGQVGFFDKRVEARKGATTQAYQQLGDELGQDQEDTKNRLGSLGAMTGAATTEQFQAARNTADPGAQAAANVEGQIAQSQAVQATTNAAIDVGEVGDRRALARQEGVEALERLTSEAEAARMELIQAMRTGNEEAAQAAAEQAAQTEIAKMQIEAQLRGQNLDSLADLNAETGRNNRAEVQANSQAAQRLAQLQMNRDRIQAQLAIARLNGDVRLQTTLQNNLASMDRAIVQQQGALDRTALAQENQNARTAVTEEGRNRRAAADRRGNTKKQYGNWLNAIEKLRQDPDKSLDIDNIINSGLARGFSPGQVLRAARVAIPNFATKGAGRDNAGGNVGLQGAARLYQALIRNGKGEKQAAQIVKSLTGFRTGPLARVSPLTP